MSEATHLSVIDIPEDCGNAPRKIVIRDFLVDLYSRSGDAVAAVLHDAIHWDIVGAQTLVGHHEVLHWLDEQPPVQSLQLHTIITHGTDCGADGAITMSDGARQSFSHVIVFSGHGKNAKIKEIRSYIVDS